MFLLGTLNRQELSLCGLVYHISFAYDFVSRVLRLKDSGIICLFLLNPLARQGQ